jgi:fluoride exporter
MSPILLVGAGGFLGAAARFGVAQYAAKRNRSAIPVGTLFVNVLGSFLLGWIFEVHRTELSLFLGTGFMGAFTTFSTLKLEGLRMWRSSAYKTLAVYYGITYTCGIVCAMAGYGIGKWLA